MKEDRDFVWCKGILIDTDKRVKFTRLKEFKVKVGDCLFGYVFDKKDPEAMFKVVKIANGIFYLDRFKYEDNRTDVFPFYKNK